MVRRAYPNYFTLILPLDKSQSLYNLNRPHLLHPFASAIDEPELKVPEEMVRVVSSLPVIVFDVWTGI
jgi:hypothetical protein